MTREEATRRNTMPNELKPCQCGNTVEVKYIAGIGESLLKYINNPFASLMPTYYINCDKCGRSMMVRLKNQKVEHRDKCKRDLIKAWNRRCGDDSN